MVFLSVCVANLEGCIASRGGPIVDNVISASLEKSSDRDVLIRFFFILWLRDDPKLKGNQSRIVPRADLINSKMMWPYLCKTVILIGFPQCSKVFYWPNTIDYVIGLLAKKQVFKPQPLSQWTSRGMCEMRELGQELCFDILEANVHSWKRELISDERAQRRSKTSQNISYKSDFFKKLPLKSHGNLQLQ